MTLEGSKNIFIIRNHLSDSKKITQEVHVETFKKKINQSLLNLTSNIEKGCNMCGLKSIKNYPTKFKKKIKFNCKHDHQVFFVPFVDYCINLFVKKIDLEFNFDMLNYIEYNKIFKYISNIFKNDKCYICSVLKKHKIKESNLYPYYIIPNYINHIRKPRVDLDILRQHNVKTKKSYVLNTKYNVDYKIDIMTKYGLKELECHNNLPIIDIKEDYVDINLLLSFTSIYSILVNQDLIIRFNKGKAYFVNYTDEVFLFEKVLNDYIIDGNVLRVNNYKELDSQNVYEYIRNYPIVIYYNENRSLKIFYDNDILKVIFYYKNKKLLLNKIFI
jgi:hypothetical protein